MNVPCETCEGTGTVFITWPGAPIQGPNVQDLDCPDCKGTGEVDEDYVYPDRVHRQPCGCSECSERRAEVRGDI